MLTQKLRISEMFASVQGEGIWVGIPSFFVRVSGCNLRCTWCDTPYASWNPEGPVLSIDEIINAVRTSDLDHVVLTGGEPMLFDPIETLARQIKSLGKTVTIETAGTLYRELDCDLMSISPKLKNSAPLHAEDWLARHEAVRLDRTPLSKLIERYNIQLKFVIGENPEADIEEIEALLATLPAVSPERILLMAEGIDSPTLTTGMVQLVPIAMQRNWRLTPRMHVDLFGNSRGT